MMASFSLNGQEVMALNGGPAYELSPAFSFFVSCEDQDEVDQLLGRADRGWRAESVRLARRQVRALVADRADGPGSADE